MTAGSRRNAAFIGILLLVLPLACVAASRVDIHIGKLEHAAGRAENVAVVLDTDGRWQGSADLAAADLPQFAQMAAPRALPVSLAKGTAAGRATFAGRDRNLERLQADLTLRSLAFSDPTGLHAGENVGAKLALDLARNGSDWRWQAALDWQQGEVFWQPLYLAAGHRISARGSLNDAQLQVESGSATLSGIGTLDFNGDYDRSAGTFNRLELAGRGLDAAKGYETLARPFLDKTMLGNLEAAGRVDLRASLKGRQVSAFEVALHDFDVEDKDGRFALYKVNARVPWALNGETEARLRFGSGRLLNVGLGAADLAAQLEGWSLKAAEWKVPVLDGMLSLQDISAALVGGKWHGHFSTSVAPMSMGEFSHAMGWPRMEGRLAASIPQVTYSGGLLTVDGAMGFDIFDGHVTVDHLVLRDPLGRAPHLSADIRMRNLDLDLLTRTFSFGAITGLLDGDVSGLELSSWQPVRFDARFRSSPGKYPKKISQRAVENISALGGAGAAAAIQRSFLRFFKEFNYARIGLSCTLRNGICAMDGIEPAKEGYVIVKGSGIPAITVMGYNRNVSWGELLGRVQRITQGNMKPIVQ